MRRAADWLRASHLTVRDIKVSQPTIIVAAIESVTPERLSQTYYKNRYTYIHKHIQDLEVDSNRTLKMSFPVQLSADAIDDLVYDARAGDLEALKSDLASLSTQHSCTEAWIVASAIDAEPEAEGGTGCCLLHFPAANGNSEILTHLLSTLTNPSSQLTPEQLSAVVNHRNHSGNTPLHWAALNTHLECVKPLVEAGADLAITNDAGLDAVFLAERADWSAQEVKEGEEPAEEEAEVEAEAEASTDGAAPMTKGRQVVEWLLSSEKAGELESGVGESAEGESAEKK